MVVTKTPEERGGYIIGSTTRETPTTNATNVSPKPIFFPFIVVDPLNSLPHFKKKTKKKRKWIFFPRSLATFPVTGGRDNQHHAKEKEGGVRRHDNLHKSWLKKKEKRKKRGRGQGEES